MDAAVLEQLILSRLVALNHKRAAEETRGLIRWLRPDYQAPATAAVQQTEALRASMAVTGPAPRSMDAALTAER